MHKEELFADVTPAYTMKTIDVGDKSFSYVDDIRTGPFLHFNILLHELFGEKVPLRADSICKKYQYTLETRALLFMDFLSEEGEVGEFMPFQNYEILVNILIQGLSEDIGDTDPATIDRLKEFRGLSKHLWDHWFKNSPAMKYIRDLVPPWKDIQGWEY